MIVVANFEKVYKSQSARTVWIEIFSIVCTRGFFVSQSARTVWIEISPKLISSRSSVTSQSARTVWIEIL